MAFIDEAGDTWTVTDKGMRYIGTLEVLFTGHNQAGRRLAVTIDPSDGNQLTRWEWRKFGGKGTRVNSGWVPLGKIRR